VAGTEATSAWGCSSDAPRRHRDRLARASSDEPGHRDRGIKPVDSRFSLAQGADAFRHLALGSHFGKIVIEI
jgi:hypothetical protein